MESFALELDPIRMQSPQEQLAHLHLLNKRGRLALFVGAGISFGCGLPTWAELIDRLTQRAYPKAAAEVISALQNLAPIPRTRLLKGKLAQRFNPTVVDCLYENSYTLSGEIQRIAKSGIQRICTYNFDDLLEEALQVAEVEFNSVKAGDPLNGNFGGTVVFHPHGFLSPSMTDDEAKLSALVLSEEDYHGLYSNPYSWANLIQLSLLINHTCLFVGVSLTDPNLRRLLDVSASLGSTHRHYAIMRSPAYAVETSELALARQAKIATEADLKSLRIEPVWVRRYEEIGEVFKAIRVTRLKDKGSQARPTARGREAGHRRRRR